MTPEQEEFLGRVEAALDGHRPSYRVGRGVKNDRSRNSANHHRAPWSASELETLTEFWDGTEETLADIAEILGRTIEACRQRYYTREDLPAGRVVHRTTTTRVETTTTEETVLVGWLFGTCSRCRETTDVYADGRASLCEDCA